MPILPFMPPQEGYEPPFAEPNQDEGVLTISHSSTCTLIKDAQRVAEILILRCVLRPFPLEKNTIKVRLISEGESLEDTLLYDEKSIAFGYEGKVKDAHYKGIGLEYTGIGKGIVQGKSFPIEGRTLPTGSLVGGPLLYVKPFKYETDTHQERKTTLPSGEHLVSPPGALDARVLRGYGGYYKEGSPLTSIQQIYYSLTSLHTHTRVRLFSSSTLHKDQTSPPQGGKKDNVTVIFSPLPREEEYLSLPGTLAAGYAKIFVESEGERLQFSSFLCHPLPGHPTLVNVHFKSQ